MSEQEAAAQRELWPPVKSPTLSRWAGLGYGQMRIGQNFLLMAQHDKADGIAHVLAPMVRRLSPTISELLLSVLRVPVLTGSSFHLMLCSADDTTCTTLCCCHRGSRSLLHSRAACALGHFTRPDVERYDGGRTDCYGHDANLWNNGDDARPWYIR
eukprot:COSAG02_NODE_83_length_39665_cov_25.213719_28_plen_156_part_00